MLLYLVVFVCKNLLPPAAKTCPLSHSLVRSFARNTFTGVFPPPCSNRFPMTGNGDLLYSQPVRLRCELFFSPPCCWCGGLCKQVSCLGYTIFPVMVQCCQSWRNIAPHVTTLPLMVQHCQSWYNIAPRGPTLPLKVQHCPSCNMLYHSPQNDVSITSSSSLCAMEEGNGNSRVILLIPLFTR